MEGNKFIMNELTDNPDFGNVSENDVPFVAKATEPLGQFDINALPVELEFVLQTERTTVAKLATCGVGAILPIRGKVGEVEIRVNGQRFGSGELVQVGDQLAVEITDFHKTRTETNHG